MILVRLCVKQQSNWGTKKKSLKKNKLFPKIQKKNKKLQINKFLKQKKEYYIN